MSHHNKHAHCHCDCPSTSLESSEALAYRLWERTGRPDGQADRFWNEAQDQINGREHPATAAHQGCGCQAVAQR